MDHFQIALVIEDKDALVALVAEGDEVDDVWVADAEQRVELLPEGAAEVLAAGAVELDGGELGL